MSSAILKTVVVGAVAVALGFVLNPGPDAHRNKISSEIAARSQLASLLHLGDVAAFASSYHTLGVASYTTVNQKVASVGAMGIVFVPDQGK
jgi:hypothetical protein